MLQRTAGSFIAKKIRDELFAPSPPDEDEEEQAYRPAPAGRAEPVQDDPQDGAEYRDDEGRLLGYTRRVANVAVYAVTSAHGSPHAALAEALRDPNSQLVFQSTNGRISGLVYIPDPDAAPGAGHGGDSQGFRPEDV